jgi:hypothetical protein
MRAMESTKSKLKVAMKHLKTRGSEDHQKLTSSEALSSEIIY